LLEQAHQGISATVIFVQWWVLLYFLWLLACLLLPSKQASKQAGGGWVSKVECIEMKQPRGGMLGASWGGSGAAE